MKALILLSVLVMAFVVPTCGVWLLGRRAKVPAWMLSVLLLAGWVAVVVGGMLSQRAQAGLFPETSPCHGAGIPVSRYFPPDSFCLHDDGELRTVNGPTGKAVFWLAFGSALAVPCAAVVRHRLALSMSADPLDLGGHAGPDHCGSPRRNPGPSQH